MLVVQFRAFLFLSTSGRKKLCGMKWDMFVPGMWELTCAWTADGRGDGSLSRGGAGAKSGTGRDEVGGTGARLLLHS